MYARTLMASLSLLLASSARAALVLDAPAGIKQGYQATFRITGATPGERVVLLKGDPGQGACPPQLGGLCLGITRHVVLGTRVADANGVAVFTPTLPFSVPIGPVSLQAAHGGATPRVSNVDTTAVLQQVAMLDISDETRLWEARYTWKVDGLSVWYDGAAPIDLPHLEEVCSIHSEVDGLQLTASNAVALGGLELWGQFGNPISSTFALPSAVGAPAGCALNNLVFAIYAQDVSVDLAAHRGSSSQFVVVSAYGAVDLYLPAVEALDTLSVDGGSGGPAPTDLRFDALATTRVLNVVAGLYGSASVAFPSLVTATSQATFGYGVAAIDIPSLTYVHTLSVSTGGTALTTIQAIGQPGFVVDSLYIDSNYGLTDISGIRSPQITDQAIVRNNWVLPSCQAAALQPVSCYGNLRDACSDDFFDICYPGT